MDGRNDEVMKVTVALKLNGIYEGMWIPPYAVKRIHEQRDTMLEELTQAAVGLSYDREYHRDVVSLDEAINELKATNASQMIDAYENVAELIEDARSELNGVIPPNEDRMLMYLVEIFRLLRARMIDNLMAIDRNWLNDPQH